MELNLYNLGMLLRKASEIYSYYDEIYISYEEREFNYNYTPVPILVGRKSVNYEPDQVDKLIDVELFIQSHLS